MGKFYLSMRVYFVCFLVELDNLIFFLIGLLDSSSVRSLSLIFFWFLPISATKLSNIFFSKILCYSFYLEILSYSSKGLLIRFFNLSIFYAYFAFSIISLYSLSKISLKTLVISCEGYTRSGDIIIS